MSEEKKPAHEIILAEFESYLKRSGVLMKKTDTPEDREKDPKGDYAMHNSANWNAGACYVLIRLLHQIWIPHEAKLEAIIKLRELSRIILSGAYLDLINGIIAELLQEIKSRETTKTR